MISRQNCILRSLQIASLISGAWTATALPPPAQSWAKAGGDEPSAIIGKDDRQFIRLNKRPWSAIGRLTLFTPKLDGGRVCTATLIAPQWIVTAGHCVAQRNSKKALEGEFCAAYNDGSCAARADHQVREAIMSPLAGEDRSGPNDWALLKLEKPLGDKVGYMPVYAIDEYEDDFLKMPLSIVGYPQSYPGPNAADLSPSRYPVWQQDCHILSNFDRNNADDVFVHDCDVVHGNSGGPVLIKKDGIYTLVAIHSGSTAGHFEAADPMRPNVSVKARRFAEMVALILKGDEAGARLLAKPAPKFP